MPKALGNFTGEQFRQGIQLRFAAIKTGGCWKFDIE